MQCWIVTEGIAGTENQCIGIAEALGLVPEIKRITLRQPWKSLSPFLKFETAAAFDPPLMPPWPDLVIAGGRKAIAAARYIKKAGGGKTFTVFVQDPRIDPSNFDLVIAPAHDSVRGKNVIVTDASPNRITPQRLDNAKIKFPQFENIRSPRVAVLIGGDSKAHKLTEPVMRKVADHLKNLDAGLMITASRRTSGKNKILLEKTLNIHPLPVASLPSLSLQGEGSRERAFFWNGTGENPYFAMLAWADHIIVTSDSVSMLSEAATTGKPVYMVELEGGAARLNQFHKNLKDKGIVRIFDGRLENWNYAPLNDAKKAAEYIAARIKTIRE